MFEEYQKGLLDRETDRQRDREREIHESIYLVLLECLVGRFVINIFLS